MQASIHQTSFDDGSQSGRDSTDNQETPEGGLADELLAQQKEEEPMDWDDIDSSLLDEINRLREIKRETDGDKKITPGSVLNLSHSNDQGLG